MFIDVDSISKPRVSVINTETITSVTKRTSTQFTIKAGGETIELSFIAPVDAEAFIKRLDPQPHRVT